MCIKGKKKRGKKETIVKGNKLKGKKRRQPAPITQTHKTRNREKKQKTKRAK